MSDKPEKKTTASEPEAPPAQKESKAQPTPAKPTVSASQSAARSQRAVRIRNNTRQAIRTSVKDGKYERAVTLGAKAELLLHEADLTPTMRTQISAGLFQKLPPKSV